MPMPMSVIHADTEAEYQTAVRNVAARNQCQPVFAAGVQFRQGIMPYMLQDSKGYTKRVCVWAKPVPGETALQLLELAMKSATFVPAR